jgi:hypothetical protein
VITPRQTRLFRTEDLRAFQRTIRRLASHDDVWRARSCAVIVPSAAAADQLRRTLENHRLLGRSSTDRALVLPQILTRSGWYDAMQCAARTAARRLSELEREVLLNAAAREAASEVEPPFRLRAGLLVEMLGLYDDLRRRDSSVDNFERVLVRELQRGCRRRSRCRATVEADEVSGGHLPRVRGAKGRDRRGRRVRAPRQAARR